MPNVQPILGLPFRPSVIIGQLRVRRRHIVLQCVLRPENISPHPVQRSEIHPFRPQDINRRNVWRGKIPQIRVRHTLLENHVRVVDSVHGCVDRHKLAVNPVVRPSPGNPVERRDFALRGVLRHLLLVRVAHPVIIVITEITLRQQRERQQTSQYGAN